MTMLTRQEETRVAESTRGEKDATDAALYPIFLRLAGRDCLVVGGGRIGFQKTRELLRCGGRVHVVSTRWVQEFAALAGDENLETSTRPFRPADLDGVILVVGATNDPAVQREILREAESRGVLCNVVDVPDLCHFYVPAVLRRGSLTLAVSSEGKSPLLAAAVRDRLAAVLDSSLAQAVDRLDEARRLVRRRHPDDPARRREALRRLLTPEAIDRILEGRLDALEAHWRSWTSSLSD